MRPLLLALLVGCGGGAPPPKVPDPTPSLPEKHETPPSPSSSGPAPAIGGGLVELHAGDFHSCARYKDGTVRCWGHNDEGQVGAGEELVLSPTLVAQAEGAIDLATAASFSCALRPDRTVMCWGTGHVFGDGRPKKKAVPMVLSGLRDVVQIEADGELLCARLASGKVECLGVSGVSGRHIQKATDIDVGDSHGCALLATGVVECFGADAGWGGSGGAPFAKPPLQGVQKMVSADRMACALLSSGTVHCWGRNLQGELGIPADPDDHKPTEVARVRGAKHLAAGSVHACAILDGGIAHCWGANTHGELGRGQASDWEGPGPAKALPAHVAEVSFGVEHACALIEDGSGYCWGGNQYGQVGDGTKSERVVPARIPTP